MPSYKFKIADSANKLLVIDVELLTFGARRIASNPDSNWTTEAAGLMAREMGRCQELSRDAAPAEATDDSPPNPVSGDLPIPELDLGKGNLFLCEMIAPYNCGMALVDFHSTFSANESGQGWLYKAWEVSGGLKAGQINWVQI